MLRIPRSLDEVDPLPDFPRYRVLTEADAYADLMGTPRPDNPTVDIDLRRSDGPVVWVPTGQYVPSDAEHPAAREAFIEHGWRAFNPTCKTL